MLGGILQLLQNTETVVPARAWGIPGEGSNGDRYKIRVTAKMLRTEVSSVLVTAGYRLI